jgi:hypothetical protein
MPAGQGNDREFDDREVFAAAVERGAAPGGPGDGGLGRDLAVVALLRAGGAELGPRPDERARARARVLARLAAADDPSDHQPMPVGLPDEPARTATTTLLADPPAGDELATRRAHRSGRHKMPSDRAGGARHGAPVGSRIVLVAAAAVLGTAVLGGAGVLASDNALPGDGLYGIKRAAESVGTAMTFDDTERGRRHLDQASTRIDEMEQLVERDPSAARDPELYRSTLRDFDSEADQGSQLLLASQDVPREQAESDLQSWAAGQAARLATLRPALPAPVAPDAGVALDRLGQLTGADPMAATPACAAGNCVDPTVDPTATGAPQGGDPTAPTAPGQTGRAPAQQRSGEPAQTGGSEQPGLLPDIVSGTPLDSVVGGSGGQAPSTAPGSSKGGGSGSGGLPPIEVPPIGPLPGVSIGG